MSGKDKQYVVRGALFVLTHGKFGSRDLVIEAFSDDFVQASLYLQKRYLDGVKLDLWGVGGQDHHHTAVAMTMTGMASGGEGRFYREWLDPSASKSLENPSSAPMRMLGYRFTGDWGSACDVAGEVSSAG